LEKVRPTDDELAQVMGHEIAHALANHVAEHMSVAMASTIGATVVGTAIAAKHEHYGLALTGAALAATLAIELPNNRTQEAEADRIGIELAARAGFDPRAAVTLWEKMARVGGKAPPEILSTHPAPEHRMEAMRALVPQMLPIYEAARKKYRGLSCR
ncbi:MAG: M48 family peptidase, partial [Gammaproteobacteria bacterium]